MKTLLTSLRVLFALALTALPAAAAPATEPGLQPFLDLAAIPAAAPVVPVIPTLWLVLPAVAIGAALALGCLFAALERRRPGSS